jgi:putative ABC transport system substrate-binding protein
MDAAKSSGCEAINFLAGPLFSVVGSRGNSIVMERTLKLRLPGIFQWPEAAEAGGLLAYGPRFTDMYRLRARIAVKVLRGTKPADIPVEQPSRFELVVNLKTATAIDYEIPAGLVLRADKVID